METFKKIRLFLGADYGNFNTVSNKSQEKKRIKRVHRRERKAKALPTKVLAEHYRQIKYSQLNSEVFTGTVPAEWNQMAEDWARYLKIDTIEAYSGGFVR